MNINRNYKEWEHKQENKDNSQTYFKVVDKDEVN